MLSPLELHFLALLFLICINGKKANDSNILSHVFLIMPNSNPNVGFQRIAQRWSQADPCASISTPQIEFHLLVNVEAIQSSAFEFQFNKFYQYIKENCKANLVFTALKSSNLKDEKVTLNEFWNILISGHVWSKKPFANILVINDLIWPLKPDWLSLLIEEIQNDEIMNEAWNPDITFSNNDMWIRSDFHKELESKDDMSWEIGKNAALKNPKGAIVNMSPLSELAQYYRDHILPIVFDNHDSKSEVTKKEEEKKQLSHKEWENIKSKYSHFDLFHSVEAIDKNKVEEHLKKLRDSTPKALFEITGELANNEIIVN